MDDMDEVMRREVAHLQSEWAQMEQAKADRQRQRDDARDRLLLAMASWTIATAVGPPCNLTASVFGELTTAHADLQSLIASPQSPTPPSEPPPSKSSGDEPDSST